mgnify:CR=1 FL=1
MKLQNIKNYIQIHNGMIRTQDCQEAIEVIDGVIVVTQATNLQIEYTGDSKGTYDVSLQITSPTLDLIESTNDDCTYRLSMHVAKHVHVSRYVSHGASHGLRAALIDTVSVDEYASVTCAYVDFAASNNIDAYTYHLTGKHAEVRLRLAVIASEKTRKKKQVKVVHEAPYSMSNMDNYGIAKDAGSLHIDGIGTITKGNHKSSSHQVNKILMFNDDCQAQANPYLYIDEYDVDAGHGASVGKIDDEQLYYLQSRGLSKEQALHLITLGYFTPIMEYITNEQVKEEFTNLLEEKVGI